MAIEGDARIDRAVSYRRRHFLPQTERPHFDPSSISRSKAFHFYSVLGASRSRTPGQKCSGNPVSVSIRLEFCGFVVIRFDCPSIRLQRNDLFKPRRDRCLNVYHRKPDKHPQRVNALGSNCLLLGPWHSATSHQLTIFRIFATLPTRRVVLYAIVPI